MKKILLLLVTVMAFGCSSDDSSNDDGSMAVTEANILGRWYMKGGTVNGGPFEDYEHECPAERDFQEIFANHTITFSGHGADCEMNDTQTSDWALSGNTLTISSAEPFLMSFSYNVVKLTNNEMILEGTFEAPEGTMVERSTFVRN
jgi:hypothetical protein